MILLGILITILAMCLVIYIRHKQAEREMHKRERLEEKQERLMEMLRNKKKDTTHN